RARLCGSCSGWTFTITTPRPRWSASYRLWESKWMSATSSEDLQRTATAPTRSEPPGRSEQGQDMGIRTHLGEFAGLPVHQFDPEAPCAQGRPDQVAYRFRDVGVGVRFAEQFVRYFSMPWSQDTTALVIGPWNGDNDEVVAELIAARPRLPR